MEILLINTSFSSYLCLACFLGALGQEVLHWYNLKLELKDDVEFYKSSTYWIITIASILFFGLTSKLLAELVFDEGNITEAKLFITAFGYPLIIKQVLKLITKSVDNNNPRSQYAPNSNTSFEVNDYFKNY